MKIKNNSKKLIPVMGLFLFAVYIMPLFSEEVETSKKKAAVFPEETADLIYIEGENAVSTNFNKEPTLNYNCSGSRTLQLSRITGLQGGSPFFAEYVFYVEESGIFEFWYGGTPPGPKDDFYPSYVSPFRYSIDDSEAVPVYREDVVVVEGYTPAYYWNSTGDLKFEAGMHKIRIEVAEKRRLDGRYYFYLDSFFFVKKDVKKEIVKDSHYMLPTDLDNTIIDNPFQSISVYETRIKNNPEKIALYLEFSFVYSLIGDYINALKVLRKAEVLDPENIYPLLLSAKNKVWKGDVNDGLNIYKQVLEMDPENQDVWLEAGKIAAWTGKYEQAISFFKEGSEYFPDNLDLPVNTGITYLWMSENEKADEYMNKAREIAGNDRELLKILAEIYLVNGYPQKAVEIYEESIKLFPDYLEYYLLLENTYEGMGEKQKAEEINRRIQDVFLPSAKLTACLKTFSEKQGLKEKLIRKYQEQLAGQPDDLSLREMLVQTYFWNGMREKAIEEYLNILTNHAYISISDFDRKSMDIFELADRCYTYREYFSGISGIVSEKKKTLASAFSEYNSAKEDKEQYEKKLEKARAENAEITVPEQGDPGDILIEKETVLADLISSEEAFIEEFNSNLAEYLERIKLKDNFVEQEKKDADVFNRLTKLVKWKWNRNFCVNELKTQTEKGNPLSLHVLGKIFQIEGQFASAERMFKNLMAQNDLQDASCFAIYQTLLWEGKIKEGEEFLNKYGDSIKNYAQYTEEIVNLHNNLKTSEEVSGFFTGEPEEEVTALLEDFKKTIEKAAANRDAVNKNLKIIHKILINRMVRNFYFMEENTYLLRYELGDFYLTQQEMTKATDHFMQVLAIDPWNISAIYKLGTVRQLYGDWYQAMKNYKQVYYTDPFFENTTKYYNALSVQNADTLEFSAKSFFDTSRISYTGTAAFKTHINSVFALDFMYDLETVRLYRTFGEENPSSYQAHNLIVRFPVDLYPFNLTVTPCAGFYTFTGLITDEITISEEETVSPSDFFETWGFSPHIAADILWSHEYFKLSGNYTYSRVTDTFVPGRETVYGSSGELNITTPLSFIDFPVINSTTLRTYGKINILDDKNIIGTVAEEIVTGIHLLDNPWTGIRIIGNAVFEHSADSGISSYYAPDGVLVLKGGAAGSSWIPLSQGHTLGLDLRIAAGAYWEHILDKAETTLSTIIDGEGRIVYAKSGSSYYLSMYGSGTFLDLQENNYWSVIVKLGCTAKLPVLLTP